MEAVQARMRLAKALSLLGVIVTFGVILMGAWTRLEDAGLGCPDWPGCYGHMVVPDSATALARFPHAPLDAGKAWFEMVHRYLAGGLGLLVVGLAWLAWRLRHVPGYPVRISLALLALIMLQGAFGAFTVTLRLWPQVVTLHLIGGMTIMLLFLWLHLRQREIVSQPWWSARMARLSRPGGLWLFAIAVLAGQLMLGGWTSSNYAGIACQGIPSCNGQWWPAMDWGEGFHLTQSIGPSYLHGKLHAEARTAIHMAHRLGAVLLGGALVVLLWRYRHDVDVRPFLGLAMAAYALQAGLGIANVLFWLPLGLALAHTAGAALLVLAMTAAVWRVTSLSRGLAPRPSGTDPEEEWVNA
ncbi:COX15/CtaA family protein [Halomonas sp. McH1-25]|uniref:COX15/CtaA family protein n=3 Tax=Halomonas TaxID=2745 RepID=UPI001EF5598C|nr:MULTISPECIES: COX15/CtaA family protein [unclassified Halomonas]MCG7598558.1 COX15/CtaA family protein [Halomonas sp. McH1-25]MCP1341810.1 COX15/CtaA family protein [Halomonas sp. FL8]MCP1364651.1 COX15/CtaA family protein [Halomonas sp. BBD48]